jgi:genome maintenance exonuclease 1
MEYNKLVIKDYFEYPSLLRVERDGKRFYSVAGMQLKSVTTILSETEDKSFLTSWRAKIGDKEADHIVSQSVGTGTQMHASLENYIMQGTAPTGNFYSKLLAKLIIDNGLINVDEVWGIEKSLYYPDLYAGTADLIGVFKGRPAIIDFKNSRSIKTLADIESYRCQGAAYALAHNYLFGTDISTIVIMMACHAGKYIEFDITGDSYSESVDMWTEKLNLTYK